MKILHTSDWHLGQKFINNERKQENKTTAGKHIPSVTTLQVKEVVESAIGVSLTGSW